MAFLYHDFGPAYKQGELLPCQKVITDVHRQPRSGFQPDDEIRKNRSRFAGADAPPGLERVTGPVEHAQRGMLPKRYNERFGENTETGIRAPIQRPSPGKIPRSPVTVWGPEIVELLGRQPAGMVSHELDKVSAKSGAGTLGYYDILDRNTAQYEMLNTTGGGRSPRMGMQHHEGIHAADDKNYTTATSSGVGGGVQQHPGDIINQGKGHYFEVGETQRSYLARQLQNMQLDQGRVFAPVTTRNERHGGLLENTANQDANSKKNMPTLLHTNVPDCYKPEPPLSIKPEHELYTYQNETFGPDRKLLRYNRCDTGDPFLTRYVPKVSNYTEKPNERTLTYVIPEGKTASAIADRAAGNAPSNMTTPRMNPNQHQGNNGNHNQHVTFSPEAMWSMPSIAEQEQGASKTTVKRHYSPNRGAVMVDEQSRRKYEDTKLSRDNSPHRSRLYPGFGPADHSPVVNARKDKSRSHPVHMPGNPTRALIPKARYHDPALASPRAQQLELQAEQNGNGRMMYTADELEAARYHMGYEEETKEYNYGSRSARGGGGAQAQQPAAGRPSAVLKGAGHGLVSAPYATQPPQQPTPTTDAAVSPAYHQNNASTSNRAPTSARNVFLDNQDLSFAEAGELLAHSARSPHSPRYGGDTSLGDFVSNGRGKRSIPGMNAYLDREAQASRASPSRGAGRSAAGCKNAQEQQSGHHRLQEEFLLQNNTREDYFGPKQRADGPKTSPKTSARHPVDGFPADPQRGERSGFSPSRKEAVDRLRLDKGYYEYGPKVNHRMLLAHECEPTPIVMPRDSGFRQGRFI
ncbi:unnamed protein product [Amoebophrya sp. A25]|nr:unnamed protein product [Amoebophrya sp. A25]|eukprot:GSA25T00010120001.1